MMTDSVLFKTEGPVGILTLNRPDALNALNRSLLEGVKAVIRKVRDDSAVRVLVVTGAGRGFCAGADLVQFADRQPDESLGEAVERSMRLQTDPVILGLDAMPKPVICAVNGVAAGGGVGIALAGDIVLAAESAKFIQVFTPQLAIIPDMGSTWYLTHLLGRARARALALTGQPLPARTAEEWGLIWKTVPDERLMDEAMALANRLAARGGGMSAATGSAAARPGPRGTVVLDAERCKGCELCIPACPPRVLRMSARRNASGYALPELLEGCTGCGACLMVCPDFCFEVYRLEDAGADEGGAR